MTHIRHAQAKDNDVNGPQRRSTSQPGTGREPTIDDIATAAALVYDDTQRDEDIAACLQVSRRTLARWKHRRDFKIAISALETWSLINLLRDVRETVPQEAIDEMLERWSAGPK